MRPLMVGAALALLAASCTSPASTTVTTSAVVPGPATTPATSAPPPRTSSTTAPLSKPVLVVSYQQECCYVEGSVTHLELFRYFPDDLDAFPLQVAALDQVAPVSETVLMEGEHHPGTYELRSHQRPCGYAACRVPRYLGSPPTDGCATRLTLQPGAVAHVLIRVEPGSACTIEVEGAEVEAPELTMNLTLREPGGSGCDPPSPVSPSGETLAANGDTVAWGLLWETPPLPVGREVKMVFRLTGEGDFGVVARHEDGTEISPSWGPNDHGQASSYARAGNEWGLAFTFPHPGCWNIQLTRGPDEADVWLEVGDG